MGVSPYPGHVQPQAGLARGTDSRSADLRALSDVTVGSVASLVGLIVGFVALFGSSVTQIFTVSTTASGTVVAENPSGLLAFGVLVVVGSALTIVELIYYRSAFRTLASYDPRFSTPSQLVLLLLIVVPILVLAAIALLDLLYQAIACAGPGNPITAACLGDGNLLVVLGVLGLLAIVALVGYVGLLLGIWRLGSRYDTAAFKVAAVLLIIPLVNVIAVILVIVSARASRDRIARTGQVGTFG